MQKPEVDLEKECRNCLYRKTGWVCKNPESSRFEQPVKSEETCGNFVASVGQAHYVRALSSSFFMLNTKSAREREQALRPVLEHYGAAITEGIPKEDEVQARIGIAVACSHVVLHRVASGNDSAVESEEGRRMLLEMGTACELEKRYALHEVAKNWYQLSDADALIAFKAAIIKRDQSPEQGERFLRQQLEIFDYINPAPLPISLSYLGQLLMRQGKNEAAAKCFRNVLNSLSRKEAVFIKNPNKFKQEAEAFLAQASHGQADSQMSRGAASRGPHTKGQGTSEKTGCFIATAVYGSDLAPEVVFLTRFRDEMLLTSGAGKRFVALYYRFSPSLAHFLTQHSRLRASIRLLVIIPALKLVKMFLKPSE